MNREETINKILAERHNRVSEIAGRLAGVNHVIEGLDSLKSRSASLQEKLQDDVLVCSNLSELNVRIDEATKKADALRQDLIRLKSRTARNTINIGIVGNPKQGKSTFLQSLTGLDEDTIPTGTSYVTGASSQLRHDPAVRPGDASAIISPYTKQEFWEDVIKPFKSVFPELNLTCLDDLEDVTLPEVETLNTTQQQQLGRLKLIKEQYGAFKGLLGSSPTKIEKSEIRRYVAQCAVNATEQYTTWYAVKTADIHCRFPQNDIGAVMICDTPGLGDFTPGAKQALLQKLSQDMDIVFFLKRPHGGIEVVSEPDAAFLDVIKTSNQYFKASDWAYLILNCAENETPTPTFLDKLNHSLACRLGVTQVNAKDPASVSQAFDRILEDAVAQIGKLDDILLKSYETQVESVRETLKGVIDTAKRALPSGGVVGEAIEVQTDVETLIDGLYDSLIKYKAELLGNKSMGNITPEIEAVLNSMKEHAPELTYSSQDEYAPSRWFTDGKDRLRAQFIEQFCHLDITMEKLVEQVKTRLQEILCSPTGGRLGFVCSDVEQGDFWAELKDLLESELGQDDSAPLCQALDNVCQIKLNCRAFILPRLTEITEGLSNAPLPEHSPFKKFVYSQTDGDINVAKNKLVSAWKAAIALVEEMFDEEDGKLQDINSTPGNAMASLIDEFILLWLRHNGYKNAMKVWRAFYTHHAREVWPEKYAGNTSLIAMTRKWNAEISSFVEKTKQLH